MLTFYSEKTSDRVVICDRPQIKVNYVSDRQMFSRGLITIDKSFQS